MIEFEDNFFEEEWREGHLVKKKMKKVWAAEMEVLVEIDRICKKYSIPYFADSGTLLGAVRHQGFIPWDDDMDIAMKRKDYERFLQVAPAELPEGWYVSSAAYVKDWKESFARVHNGRKISFAKEYLERFHGCPYMVGVDIFPLDQLPPEEEKEMIHCILQVSYAAAVYLKEQDLQEAEEKILWIEENCRQSFDRNKNMLNQIYVFIDTICKLYQTETETDLVQVVWWIHRNKPVFFAREWYEESILMPFENIYVPVPVNYQDVLKVLYGDDYMVPKKGLASHTEYFYLKQDRAIRAIVDEMNLDFEWEED